MLLFIFTIKCCMRFHTPSPPFYTRCRQGFHIDYMKNGLCGDCKKHLQKILGYDPTDCSHR